jgi:hypothetical protein
MMINQHINLKINHINHPVFSHHNLKRLIRGFCYPLNTHNDVIHCYCLRQSLNLYWPKFYLKSRLCFLIEQYGQVSTSFHMKV